MAVYDLPKATFEPHPEGAHTGTIVEVRDMGQSDTQYGTKHRVAVVIEADNLTREDGDSWRHFEFVNLASGENSKLTKLPQKLLRRKLTGEERDKFDPDSEMLDKSVSYTIAHEFGDNRTFANIASWSILDDGDDSEKLPF